MNNYAEKLAAEANRKLFINRDHDDNVDFTIISKDGRRFGVHSHIVQYKSEVLMRMMTSDFKEKHTRAIELRMFNSKTVEYFLKFLYGFELDNEDKDLDLATLKELTVMGDMYDVKELQAAAILTMDRYLKISLPRLVFNPITYYDISRII